MLNYRSKRRAGFAMFCVCSGSFLPGCWVQAADDVMLEEVLVTAQRRVESLRDVPISISVYSSEDIDTGRIEGLQDYMQQTPNVAFNNAGTSTSYEIGIRGVSNIGGASNVFGVYVDEFNVAPGSANTTFDQRLLDIDRLEVLRGPQGTFFGRNVSGGAINIVTRKPQPQFEAQVLAEVANHDSYLLRGSVNLPASDTLMMRFSGFGENYGGFLKNGGPSNATNDREGYGGRAALRYAPSDQLTADLSVSYTKAHHGLASVVPSGVLDAVLSSFGLQAFPVSGGFYPHNVDRIDTDIPWREHTESLIATGRLEYAGDGFSIVSVTGLIDNKVTDGGESDFTSYNMYFDDAYNKLKSWSTELRAQSNRDGAWQWMIGGIYAQDDIDVFRNRSFGADWFHVLLGLPQGFPIPPRVSVINDLRQQDIRTYGIFGELSWTGFGDRLKLSLSGRWQHDDIEQGYYAPRQSVFPPFVATLDDFSGKASFSSFMPRFATTYKFSAGLSGYLVVAKGVKPGGYNLGSDEVPGSPSTYDAEELWNYELGLKGELFQQRLRFELAAFRMDWQQIQVGQFFFDPVTLSGVDLTVNGASAKSQGLELSLSAALTRGLRVSASVGYTDATFDDFPNAIIGANGQTADLTGKRLPLSAKWSGTGSVEYRFGAGALGEAFAKAEYIYRGDTYRNIQNRDIAGDLIPSYDLWNLRLGFEQGRYSVIGFVDNVTNEHYVGGWLADSSLSGVLAVMNPRSYGVRVIARFQ